MGLFLIIIGLIVALLFNWTLGIVLMLIGAIVFFVPAAPYGYSRWHDRRGP